MESWDSENFEPKVAAIPIITNKWEGEDEEEDVKESWEDEDEEPIVEEKKETPPPIQPTKPKKRNLAEIIAEKERQKREMMERKLKEQEEEDEDDISPEERIRRQKESDLNAALETTFGGNDMQTLDSMCPSTKEEFEEFSEAFMKKIKPLVSKTEFVGFAENLIRNLCATLNSNDIKKIKTTIDNLVLEKQKIEKGDKAKKNKGKGKAKLKIDNDNQYSAYVDDYDEFDDFM